MIDTATPLHLQVVDKLAYRYGDTAAERKGPNEFVRINAFASRACHAESFESISRGTPIRGIIDLEDIDYRPAQLIG